MKEDSSDFILWLTTPSNNAAERYKQQQYLYTLGEIFNIIVGSDRQIIPNFYDCGTNARAMFLSLIMLNRDNLDLTDAELQRIKEQYNSDWDLGSDEKIKNLKTIMRKMGPGVIIMSIRFWLNDTDQFGHVWIFEKINTSGTANNKNNFNIYQSALGNYTVADYYNEYGNIIDPYDMLDKMEPLLRAPRGKCTIKSKNNKNKNAVMNDYQVWDKKTSKIFTNIFKFTPKISFGTSICPELLYAYVEY